MILELGSLSCLQGRALDTLVGVRYRVKLVDSHGQF